MTETIPQELEKRLRQEAAHHGGAMPERTALVWHGYLAACLERGLIEIEAYRQLVAQLPVIPDNPVEHLFLGR
ncbi:MAG TPA: hypothetical protein RMG48_19975 [Myxococcales bacterium LLY-WYZ-16_1]|jgi:hypothetical protein|nr:hypothetical protein [Myxococcales bacterium LLY-WYZ-16_1]